MLKIDHGEAKSIEQDYTQMYLATAQLIAALLQQLRKNPEIKVELEDEKPPKVEIKVGREIAYRGIEGQAPEINKLTPEQVNYLAEVLTVPAAGTSSEQVRNKQMDRAVTIKVNNEVVYKLSKGVVQVNKLQPELAQEIAKSIAAPQPKESQQVTASAEVSKTPIEVAPPGQKSQPLEAIEQPAVAENSLESNPEQVNREQATEATEVPQKPELTATEVQPQSPLSNVEDKFIESLIVLEQRAEQSIHEGPLKQWLNRAVEVLKSAPKKAQSALKQAPGQVASSVRSLPERMRDQAIASTALDLFHKMPYRGTQDNVYEAEGYAIESKGQDVYSIKNNENREVMRFKDTILGPRVLENNMSPSEQKDFLQVRNQVNKYGLSDLISSDPFNQVAQLGKLAPAGTLELKQNLVNREVALNALKVLENFGETSKSGIKAFEGKDYRVEQKDDNVTITAKDGRGAILQSQAGEIKANLSPKDVSQFNAIGREVDKVLSQRGQSENSVIQTAEKLIQNFGSERPGGSKVFEGKSNYQIEQQGNDLKITAKDNRGVILQRQSGQVKSNLSPSDISKFEAIGNEFAKREMKQVVSVIQTAKNLVQTLGKEAGNSTKVFEGNNYQIKQTGNDITITAKDERGKILRQQGGTTRTELSPQDISKFEATGREIDKHLAAAQQAQSRQPQSGVELGA